MKQVTQGLMKTGSRIVVGLAGSYFKRLKQYYRDKFGFNPEDNQPVFMEMFGRRKGNSFYRYAKCYSI